MNKKILIELLSKIQTINPKIQALYELVKKLDVISDSLLKTLIKELNQLVQGKLTENDKVKLKKSIDVIEQISKLEKEDREKEMVEIESLLENI